MKTNFLVEKTALIEFSQKYDLEANVKIEKTLHTDLLLSIYHLGFDCINENVKDEYKQAINFYTREQWSFLIIDLVALLSQISKNNYKILLNDINQLN